MQRSVGQHHGDLRRALVDAALELIDEGVDPGLRAVARRAGVSPGAPYHHFGSRDELLAEVAAEGFVALGEAQAAAQGTGGDRLEAMAAAYVRFGWRHPTHYRVMFSSPPSPRGGRAAEGLRRAAGATFSTLVEAVAQANPTLGPTEAQRRALLGWALAHGVVQVGTWPGLPGHPPDPESLAAEAGRAVRVLAEAPG